MSTSQRFAKKLGAFLKVGNTAEISKKCGLSRSILYRFKNGKNAPGIDTAEKIANALGYTLAEFIADPSDNYGHSVDECLRRVVVEFKKRK